MRQVVDSDSRCAADVHVVLYNCIMCQLLGLVSGLPPKSTSFGSYTGCDMLLLCDCAIAEVHGRRRLLHCSNSLLSPLMIFPLPTSMYVQTPCSMRQLHFVMQRIASWLWHPKSRLHARSSRFYLRVRFTEKTRCALLACGFSDAGYPLWGP